MGCLFSKNPPEGYLDRKDDDESRYGVLAPYITNTSTRETVTKERKLADQTELQFKVPATCTCIAGDEAVILIDMLAEERGLHLWRSYLPGIGIVAAKVFTNNRSDEDNIDRLALFQNELEVLNSLKHVNIIRFYGYQETPGPDALERRIFTEFAVDTVYTYINHRTIEGRKTMLTLEVAQFAYEISSGLKYLHDIGIAHRSLSSDNVVLAVCLLDEKRKAWLKKIALEQRKSVRQQEIDASLLMKKKREDDETYYNHLPGFPLTAKLCNFGESKTLRIGDELIRTKTQVGDIQYMCPEMFKREEYDFSCDIWSFGAVLYEMMIGKRPFDKKKKLCIY